MEKELQEELIRIGKAIEDGNCSYGELTFLQEHKQEVLEIGDIRLCEQAEKLQEIYNVMRDIASSLGKTNERS